MLYMSWRGCLASYNPPWQFNSRQKSALHGNPTAGIGYLGGPVACRAQNRPAGNDKENKAVELPGKICLPGMNFPDRVIPDRQACRQRTVVGSPIVVYSGLSRQLGCP